MNGIHMTFFFFFFFLCTLIAMTKWNTDKGSGPNHVCRECCPPPNEWMTMCLFKMWLGHPTGCQCLDRQCISSGTEVWDACTWWFRMIFTFFRMIGFAPWFGMDLIRNMFFLDVVEFLNGTGMIVIYPVVSCMLQSMTIIYHVVSCMLRAWP